MLDISGVLESNSMVVRNLCNPKATWVDGIWLEMLKAKDNVELCGYHTSLVLHRDLGQCLWTGKLLYWSLFIKKRTRGCVPITGESHS